MQFFCMGVKHAGLIWGTNKNYKRDEITLEFTVHNGESLIYPGHLIACY
jgi:hypothetical protein